MRAARYLGVPPWVLAEQSAWWVEAALVAQSAENYAEWWQMKHPEL